MDDINAIIFYLFRLSDGGSTGWCRDFCQITGHTTTKLSESNEILIRFVEHQLI